jgi:hypothetical protein
MVLSTSQAQFFFLLIMLIDKQKAILKFLYENFSMQSLTIEIHSSFLLISHIEYIRVFYLIKDTSRATQDQYALKFKTQGS